MNERLIIRAASAALLLFGCSSKRDLGNVPDGGRDLGSAGGSGGSSAGGSAGGGEAGSPGGGGAGGAGGAGGPIASCDLTKPFGAPTVVPNINSSSDDAGASLADDLTLYLCSNRPGGAGDYDLYVATRPSVTDAFATPQPLTGINTSVAELWPRVTSDELTMFYYQHTSSAGGEIFLTSRSSVAAAFAPGVPLAQVNLSDSDQSDLSIWRDGETLYFDSNRAGSLGGFDIYSSTRRADGSYGTAQAVSELNTTGQDSNPVVTQDGLTIYWGSDRNGAAARHIWTATRASTADPFSNLAVVPELNSSYVDYPTWISSDGCHIYITTTRPGGPGAQDIWEAMRPPITNGATQ
jgi:hypothetical protein